MIAEIIVNSSANELNRIFDYKVPEGYEIGQNIDIGYRVLGMIIPVAIFVIYLLISGTFQDFISYAVSGIKYFDNSIAYSLVVAYLISVNCNVEYLFKSR